MPSYVITQLSPTVASLLGQRVHLVTSKQNKKINIRLTGSFKQNLKFYVFIKVSSTFYTKHVLRSHLEQNVTQSAFVESAKAINSALDRGSRHTSLADLQDRCTFLPTPLFR